MRDEMTSILKEILTSNLDNSSQKPILTNNLDMPEICMRYAYDKPKYAKDAQDMPELCK